jgi:predicted nucleic acid-binding protein
MSKVLFDASVYIRAWREKDEGIPSARTWQGATVHLSAVVGLELLRGARDRLIKRDIQRLWKGFGQAGRLVVPSASVWRDTGIVLAKLAEKYGYESIGQAKLTHDALIALSARQQGITVVTLNRSDFERIAEFRPVKLLQP